MLATEGRADLPGNRRHRNQIKPLSDVVDDPDEFVYLVAVFAGEAD